MVTIKYICVLFIGNCLRDAVSLECYNCSNITHVTTCRTTTTCQRDQSCYLDFSITNGYTLGCIENRKCGALPQVSVSLVGRNFKTEKQIFQIGKDVQGFEHMHRDLAKRETQQCFECCSFDICNKHLCDHLKPTACIDDPKIDCAWLNSKFNICQNIHESKTVCPKFCDLCSLVDGGWAEWTVWSVCDVTCDNGTQTRIRQCSNPTPVNGGLPCSGSEKEYKTCVLQTCPIDGNWAEWSSWSKCDVTCANGSQTRTRICNNPTPAYNGRNCSGNPVEYKGCINDNCPIHGGWTSWLSWEDCSVTCGIGIQRRHRNCSNPIPQFSGHYCFGDTMDVTICMPRSCADGVWSMWGTWTSCSVTCGAGIKSRTRTCTNPRPSILGQHCDGESLQDVSCNTNACITPTIAFRAHHLKSLEVSTAGIFVFTEVTLNVGNGYNSSSGIFTAPQAGTYFFSTKLCISYSLGNNAYCNIVHNGNAITRNFLHSNNVDLACYNDDVIAVVQVNDRVWVEHTPGKDLMFQSPIIWNTFTGSLLHL